MPFGTLAQVQMPAREPGVAQRAVLREDDFAEIRLIWRMRGDSRHLGSSERLVMSPMDCI